MNRFITETDVEYNRKQSLKALVVIFLVLSALSCLGFLIAVQTFIYFEAITLIGCVVSFFVTRKKHDFELDFTGDKLTITNRSTNESYVVYDVPQSDFIIKQTKKEEIADYCSFYVKYTIFSFGGVKKCTELREYIKNNF